MMLQIITSVWKVLIYTKWTQLFVTSDFPLYISCKTTIFQSTIQRLFLDQFCWQLYSQMLNVLKFFFLKYVALHEIYKDKSEVTNNYVHLVYAITSIKSRPVRLAAILVIMSISSCQTCCYTSDNVCLVLSDLLLY